MEDNSSLVVTTGPEFTDIDGLACVIAYSGLLELEGKENKAYFSGPFNYSITKTIQNWGKEMGGEVDLGNSQFVVTDISDPEAITRNIKLDSIIEIFDHHYGHEDYWKERLKDKAHIETLGACATLIWEEYQKRSKSDQISAISADLLYTAIVSNTLNFRSSLTTQRDRDAFGQLKEYIDLPEDWIPAYFNEQQKYIQRNLKEAIKNDTKAVSLRGGKKLVISQLEVWDGRKFVQKNLGKISEIVKAKGYSRWFVTSPSIKDGVNIIYSENEEVKAILSRLLNLNFEENMATTQTLILRKQILKLLKEKGYSN